MSVEERKGEETESEQRQVGKLVSVCVHTQWRCWSERKNRERWVVVEEQ